MGIRHRQFHIREVTVRMKRMLNLKIGKMITAVVVTAALIFVATGCTSTQKAEETSEEIESYTDAPVWNREVDGPKDFGTFVKSLIGCPYVSDGSYTDGFDESGLVMYCYKEYYSIVLPHDSNEICLNSGEEISKDELIEGDVICYDDGSIAIYVGDEQVVYASATEGSVCYGDLDMKNIKKIKQIVSHSDSIEGLG